MSDQGFGYGQISDDDSTDDLTAIVAIIRQLIGQLNVMKLVQVKAVTPGTGTPPTGGTVDVQLLVSQLDGQGNPVQHGIVHGLPVFRLQAGPWAIIADPVVGDYGFIVCADRDSSLVLKNPGIANPGSIGRRYNVADGVYVGGVGSMNAAPTSWVQLNSDGTWNLTDKNGNVLKGSSNGIAITGNVAVRGNITATGSIISGFGGADQVGLQTHTHPSNGSPPTPGT